MYGPFTYFGNFLPLLLLLNILVQWGGITDEARLRSSAAVGIIVTVGFYLTGFISSDYSTDSLSLFSVAAQFVLAMIIGMIVWLGLLVFGKDQRNLWKRLALQKKKVIFLFIIMYMILPAFNPFGPEVVDSSAMTEGEVNIYYHDNKSNECLRTALDENGINYRIKTWDNRDFTIWRPEYEAQKEQIEDVARKICYSRDF